MWEDEIERSIERRLYKLRAGQEDEWREMWVWGYAWMVGCWLLIAIHIPKRKFPWNFDARPLKFLNKIPARKFENFCTAAKPPALPSEPFQHMYKSARPYLYRKVVKSALLRSHRMILGSGALALCLSWWLRSAYYVHFKYPYGFLVPEAVRTNFAAGAKVHEIMLPLSSLLLSLYVVFNVARLYRIMDLAWKVQGRIYDFAILLGTLLMPHHSDSRVRAALWKIHRLLNLAHVLAYEEVSEGVRISSGDTELLKESGLVEERESDELERSNHRIQHVFVWLSNLTNRLIEARIISQTFAPAILEALSELLDIVSIFHTECLRTPPVAVGHMMQLCADFMCILTPAMLAHIFHADDPSPPTYFWPWAGSMVTSIFYQGMMCLAQALETPFDDHIDGLSPDWALATTERQIYGCLAGGQVGGPAMPVEDLKLSRAAPLRERTQSAHSASASPTYGQANVGVGSALATFAPGGPVQMSPMPMTEAERNSASPMRVASNFAVAADPDDSDEDDKDAVPRMRKEKVPIEQLPSEAHTFVPREVGQRGFDSRVAKEANSSYRQNEESSAGALWGTLDKDLLQATRAALLVPREITLDDVSLERLETVTARPLSELAAALLRAEPAPSVQAMPLALTEAPHVHVPPNEVTTIRPNEMTSLRPNEVTTMGSGHAGSDVRDLVGRYHHELRQNSDMRAQLAAVSCGLAAPPPVSELEKMRPLREDAIPGAQPRRGPKPGRTAADAMIEAEMSDTTAMI